MNDLEHRLSDLLHKAAPEPPSSIDLRVLADRARLEPAPRSLLRRWSTPLLAAAAVIAVIAGTAVVALVVRGDDQPADIPQGAGPSRAELDQANRALANWEKAGLVPIIPRTELVGDWEPSVAENNKLALEAGRFDIASKLDVRPPAEGVISWQSGESRPTQVQPAATTLQTLRTSSDCDGCTPLTVTGASRATMTVQSSKGPAVVPAWRFTLQGTKVQILRSAVAVPKVTPLPHDPYSPEFFHGIDSAALSADQRTLTATFTGSPLPATEPCGEDYTAHVVESETAVAVIIVNHPYTGDPPRGCEDVGARRQASVQLASPLSGRTVLSIQQGTPVPVTTS